MNNKPKTYRQKNEEYDNSMIHVINFIDRYQIKYIYLAKKIGIARSSFTQKMKYKTFNYHQLKKLYNYIMDMQRDAIKISIPVQSVSKIDFMSPEQLQDNEINEMYKDFKKDL
jgi:hypothetical protein